jgi:hypothetical protein
MFGGGRFGATACEEEPSDDEDGHCGDEHMTGARGPSRRPPPLPMEGPATMSRFGHRIISRRQ